MRHEINSDRVTVKSEQKILLDGGQSTFVISRARARARDFTHVTNVHVRRVFALVHTP